MKQIAIWLQHDVVTVPITNSLYTKSRLGLDGTLLLDRVPYQHICSYTISSAWENKFINNLVLWYSSPTSRSDDSNSWIWVMIFTEQYKSLEFFVKQLWAVILKFNFVCCYCFGVSNCQCALLSSTACSARFLLWPTTYYLEYCIFPTVQSTSFVLSVLSVSPSTHLICNCI